MKNASVSKEVRDRVLNHKDQSVGGEHYSSSARMEVQVRNAMIAWSNHLDGVIGKDTLTARWYALGGRNRFPKIESDRNVAE